MEWKEKFLAFAIMVVLYYLVTNILGQIFSQQPQNMLSYLYFIGLGVIAIALSLFLIKIDAISSGVMFGGILLIITGGFWYYWQAPSQLEKTIILLVAFVVLIGIGYFKFSDKKLTLVKK